LFIIQFIRPKRNVDKGIQAGDITRAFNVPGDIQRMLQVASYDCHSNNTNYPWYFKIQPVGWWLADHVRKGKAELNFNEFGSYSVRRQISKLNGIANSVRDKTMPLKSYTILHKNARLSKEQRQSIIDWASKTKDSLSKK
jgi:hypothetical protein